MRPIRKTEFVEVVIDSITKKEFKFAQNLSVMENAKILSIESYNATKSPKSPLSGANIANINAFKSAFLTLRTYLSKADDITLYPLTSLDIAQNNGVTKEFDSVRVDLGQSKVTVADPTTLVVGEVFVFVFTYEDLIEKC
jgi:hypothetical protein